MATGHVYAALLRGINVGGHAKLPMRELVELCDSLGHADAASYIQSGNLAFRSAESKPAVSRGLEEGIAREFGLEVKVILRTPTELGAIVSANPFPAAVSEPSKLHVVFLERAPQAKAELDPDRSPGDFFTLAGSEIYMHLPSGAGRTKLSLDWFERRLGVRGTARNWNTLLKLLELTESRSHE